MMKNSFSEKSIKTDFLGKALHTLQTRITSYNSIYKGFDYVIKFSRRERFIPYNEAKGKSFIGNNMNKDFLQLISKEKYTKEDFDNKDIYLFYDLISNNHSEDEDRKLGLVEDKKYIDTDKDGNRYFHYDLGDNFEAVYIGRKYDNGKLNAIFIFLKGFNILDDIKIGSDFNLENLKNAFSKYEVSVINDEMIRINLEEGTLNIVCLNKKINEFEFYFK